eukprot:TRINITY_DN14347_c0_g1_i1.p1 TRINITY_DN14347_c0_g1~~TRINITY_DN14347_c0_g1_i1.p1  ORF type:complete len:193 (+),score=30.15 TRINITY_DN14347_c0_g1_i1:95-673(+)
MQQSIQGAYEEPFFDSKDKAMSFVEIQPNAFDTLESLAVKYNTTAQKILQANRMYTPHDSIHSRKTLRIPTTSNLSKPHQIDPSTAAKPAERSTKRASDVNDFLKQFDQQFATAKASSESNLRAKTWTSSYGSTPLEHKPRAVLSHREQREQSSEASRKQTSKAGKPLSVAAADTLIANDDQWDEDDELFEL